METKYRRLFTAYYFLSLLFGISGILILVSGKKMSYGTFFEIYESVGFSGFSPLSYFLSAINVVIFLLSIILVVLICLKKIPKVLLIYPIYYVLRMVVWHLLLPSLISRVCLSLSFSCLPTQIFETCYLEMRTVLAGYEIIFDFIDMILPAYFIYWLYKKK